MSIDDFDLKALLGHFQDVGQEKWGLILDTGRLKEQFRPIKEKQDKFSRKHLELIMNDPAFPSWWKMPQLNDSELENICDLFNNIKPHDANLVWPLFDLLKNIELVSCILCFIDPMQYAIFSVPVENLLNIRGRNQVEKYVKYLINLEEIAEAYKFTMIADVDHALWALANIINSDKLRNRAPYNQFYREYTDQPNLIKTIAAKNSLRQVWTENPLYLDLARLFLEENDAVLAGLIASREFEFAIKKLCRDNGVKLSYKAYKHTYWLNMEELAEKLKSKKAITTIEEEAANKYRDLRNHIVHGSEEYQIKPDDIADMIGWLDKLCKKYDIRMRTTSGPGEDHS